jgi:hypothetical protein
MKICRICEMENSEEVDVCKYCSAPFDLSEEEIRAINKFFQNLVNTKRGGMRVRSLRKDEAYFLYKLAPKVLGSCISEL